MYSVGDSVLTVTDLSYLLDVSTRTINYWCERGKLSSQVRNSRYANRKISASTVLNFLYLNPYLQKNLFSKMVSKRYTYLQYWLYEEINKRPKLYNLSEVATIFGLTDSAIRVWVITKKLKESGFRSANNQRLIFKSDLEEFVKTHPQYRKNYMAYNERESKSA